MKKIRRHLKTMVVAALLLTAATSASAFYFAGDKSGWDYTGTFLDNLWDYYGAKGAGP